jgi:hypothetical protein
MSKNIDPDYMTEDDLAYVRDRPTLQQEFILQGYGDVLAQDADGNYTYAGLVDKDGEYINGSGPNKDDSEGEVDDGGDTNVQSSMPENEQWTDEMDKEALQAVIDARNENREPDGDFYINVNGTGSNGAVKKSDLSDALREDDTRVAEYRAEHPEEFADANPDE